MKKDKTFFGTVIFLVMTLLFSVNSFGQTYANEKSENSEQIEIVVTGSNDTAASSALQNLGFDVSDNPRNQTIVGNSVFLAQIGDGNFASVATATNASEIIINQEGDENFVGLDYRTNTAIAEINQFGDNNYLTDFIYTETDNVSLDLTQEGSNLSFQRFGSNSITNSLKFKQTEGAPVIIVRSFN